MKLYCNYILEQINKIPFIAFLQKKANCSKSIKLNNLEKTRDFYFRRKAKTTSIGIFKPEKLINYIKNIK